MRASLKGREFACRPPGSGSQRDCAANIRVVQGRNSEALELRSQALGTARAIGSRKDILGALINLANLQLAQSQLDDAAGTMRKQSSWQETPTIRRTGQGAAGQRSVLFQKADYDNAAQMWKQARKAPLSGRQTERGQYIDQSGFFVFPARRSWGS